MKANKWSYIILLGVMLLLVLTSYKEVYNIYLRRGNLEVHYADENYIKSYDDLKDKCTTMSEEEIDEASYFEDCQPPNCGFSSLTLKQSCEAYKEGKPLSPDVYTVFHTMINSDLMYLLQLYIVPVLLVACLFNLNKKMRSKYTYYYIQRNSYKSFIVNMFKETYLYVLTIPILLGLHYLLSLTVSQHHVYEYAFTLSAATFDLIHYQTPGFILLLILNATIAGLVIINLGLIFIRKNKNLIFTIIEAWIAYFVILFVVEGLNLPDCFHLWMSSSYEVSIYYHLLCTFTYFIVTLVITILLYKNKEKTLVNFGGVK